MPINRRAIIHIGGKKVLKNRNVLKLNTPNNQIFKNIGDKKSLSFIVDPNAKQQKTKIQNIVAPEDIRKYNITDKYINVNKFKYYDDEQIKKLEEQKNIKDAQELKKITESIKKQFSKDEQIKGQRKKMGMGTFLQDLKFPIKYYEDIRKEFVEFEKKFFLDAEDTEKFNIFRFKLRNDYKLEPNPSLLLSNINKQPHEAALITWGKLNQLSPNEPFIKKNMFRNFDRIIKDVDRNVGSFIDNKCKGFHEYNFPNKQIPEFWKNPFYFYTTQLCLFFQYYFLKHSNIDEWFIDFNQGALYQTGTESIKKTIYNAVINGKIKGINHSFIKQFAATKMKTSWENMNHHDTYGQTDLPSFIQSILSTSNIKKKTFNIHDAAALHTHIFFKQKLHSFFQTNFGQKDKKYCLKSACKIISYANFMDPYLFTELWDYIDEKWKDSGYPSIDTIKLGQLHMHNTKYSKFNPHQRWLWSEQKKFNASRPKGEEPFTTAEIIDKIKAMPSPNTPHKAFLNISKKTKTDKLFTYIKDDDSIFPPSFDGEFTKMDWLLNFSKNIISDWLTFPGINAMTEELNGTNKDYRLYMKYLYKYGIDGCIIFNLIHFKNLRTSINLNKKKHIRNLKDIMNLDKYDEDANGEVNQTVQMLQMAQFPENQDNGFRNTSRNTIANLALWAGFKSAFYLSGRPPTLMNNYNLKKSLDEQQDNFTQGDREGMVIDTPDDPYWNKFLNPLTCNVEETYGKHFDYCIEQIEKQHGSLKKYNEKFDKLFSNSLILYKNGFLDDHRLKEIKKNNYGIKIVNKITDIWNIHKDDKRIYFPKRDGLDDDVLSRFEGWLGNLESNTIQHALDGIYHIDYTSFMKKTHNLLVPFVPVSMVKKRNRNIFCKDFEWNDSYAPLYDSEKTKLLWPRNSGRPFIFINKYQFLYTDKKKVGDKGKLKIKKHIYKSNEIADKIKNSNLIGMSKDKKIGLAIPDYWFDREYPFPNKDIITHIKLKTLLDSGYDKYKIIVNDINQKLLEGGIIESLPEEREFAEAREKETEIIVDAKTPEEEEEVAERLAQIESDRLEAERIAQEEKDRLEAERLAKIESDRQAEVERLAQEQLKKVQETSAAIDTLEGDIDERLEEPEKSPKVVFIEKLLVKNPQITDEKLRENFNKNNDFKGTTSVALGFIINLARTNLQDEEKDNKGDKKLPAHVEESVGSKDSGDIKTQALKKLGLKRVKVKDDGDCLFASLLMTLDNGKNDEHAVDKKATVMKFRGKIVDYITNEDNKRDRTSTHHGQKVTERLSFWDLYGNGILTTPSAGTENPNMMYKDKAAYKEEMSLPEANELNPRSRFGGITEIIAFQELFETELGGKEVQIIRWNETNRKWDVWFPQGEQFNPENPTIIFEGLHYDFAQKIPKHAQAGGGNNVYINKCKNHRHKRTRKFRIRFKNVGDWVHLNKPKKKTRRKY